MDRRRTQGALEVLYDDEGSVSLGWLGEHVLFTRFDAGISSNLGERFAMHLEAAIDCAPSLRYYSDASALNRYDPVARRAFVQVVLANRMKFDEFVMLTWCEWMSPAASALANGQANAIDVLTDPAEFNSRLFRAAPQAKHRIAACRLKSVRFTRSSR